MTVTGYDFIIITTDHTISSVGCISLKILLGTLLNRVREYCQ